MQLEAFGQTVLVDGVQLTSAIDRAREAQQQAEQVPAGATECWVYGPALGDVIRVLLGRSEMERVNVVVLNRALFDLVPDDREWLKDTRVRLQDEPTDIVNVPFVASPTELRTVDVKWLPLRDRLLATINTPYNDFIQLHLASKWAEHKAANSQFLAVDPHVRELDCTTIWPCMVIAGGPSTKRFYNRIRNYAGKRKIVAASTALIPLLGAGIIPHVVVVLDRLPVMLGHFPLNVSALKDSTLVYINEVSTAVLERWPGKRFWMKERDLYPGGSVLHAEVDLAVRMGSPQVEIFGADLCFAGDRSHLDGSPGAHSLDGRGMFSTVNGLGEVVQTEEALLQYHRTLEDLIEMYPNVKFVKFGREGVPVKGAEWAEEPCDTRAA